MNCIQTENPIDSVNKGSINHNVRKKKKAHHMSVYLIL